eukprot:CAMPEP_0118677482 /NCGR_PEP_ID=MMETSP0800-20121206/2652_1 /TAXON_ID=210618 ORGANISM="Striatella unipunctata, Strain CCMP2910" /NCGR_SAMPLE_ID=MMETSP0800 /ASSEMBLY_ACC=CAM_ASM_000638 /LENGTH=531 /DNA_ID=CAMNT_0006573161 /DNA_START=55 /DNA_END=1650 /DNA_ORIENTATION=+
MSGVAKILEAAAIHERGNGDNKTSLHDLAKTALPQRPEIIGTEDSMPNDQPDRQHPREGEARFSGSWESSSNQPTNDTGGPSTTFSPTLSSQQSGDVARASSATGVDLSNFVHQLGGPLSVYSISKSFANQAPERMESAVPDLSKYVSQLGGSSAVYSVLDQQAPREQSIPSFLSRFGGAPSVAGFASEQEIQDRALLLQAYGGNPTLFPTSINPELLRSDHLQKQLLATRLREAFPPAADGKMTQTELMMLRKAEEEASLASARLNAIDTLSSRGSVPTPSLPNSGVASKHPLEEVSKKDNDKARMFQLRASPSFPEKLMCLLLDDPAPDVITWLPHGNSFIILRPDIFITDILPRYFKPSKFASFARKLHRWGFVRIMRGMDTGAYYHNLFKRDQPELCSTFGCQEPEAGKEGSDNVKTKNTDEKKKIESKEIANQTSEQTPAHRPVSPQVDDTPSRRVRTLSIDQDTSFQPAPKKAKMNNEVSISQSTLPDDSVKRILNRVLKLGGLAQENSSAAFILAAYQERLTGV